MVEKMSSGHLSITLVKNVEAQDFPPLAKKWSTQLGAKVHNEAFNFDVRLWVIELSGELFYLAWDIWQTALTLESRSTNGDEIIKNLKLEY
jgi:hypothetical protein